MAIRPYPVILVDWKHHSLVIKWGLEWFRVCLRAWTICLWVIITLVPFLSWASPPSSLSSANYVNLHWLVTRIYVICREVLVRWLYLYVYVHNCTYACTLHTHTLDKNGSLYDPAGTESWNMQIWSWIVSTSTIFSKIFQIHRRHSRRNNPNNRKYNRRNNPNNRKYNRRHDLGENTEEGSDASKTDCGNREEIKL